VNLKMFGAGMCGLALVTLAIGALLSTGDARAAGGNPSAQPPSCVTGSCHSGMGQAAFVHGPAAAGECVACHVPEAQHKFKRITDVGRLCAGCHEDLITKKVVHKPVGDGKCTACHDPHQSPFRFQLKAENAALCFRCHDRAIVAGKFVHGPAAVGSCGTCHAMHQSDFPKLLTARGNDVCFECHADKADAFKEQKFVHAPVLRSCVSCHNPHSANNRYTLIEDGAQKLCFSCHKDQQVAIGAAAVKHKGLDTKRQCLACHDPHVSNYARLLTRQPAELCLSCHDRDYNGRNRKVTVANMQAYLAENLIHHGPIKQNDCSGCHNAHGSANFRILRENFPPLFYAEYNPDNYRLCFMCHDPALAAEARTTTLTGFRNGSDNLHYVHVNKVKGRTCRACHDAHATNNPKHVRDAVPFANWNLPVGFVKSDRGGACLPGCHQQFSYDRDRPVVNK
jgi:predicted CXXCH cytochrome family protein